MIARIGINGTAGQRNARGRSGRFLRSTITAIETSVNAASVPILTSSASTVSGTTAAIRPKMMPTSQVAKNGVPYFGCTFDRRAGIRPSRDIANRMRVWPYAITSITVLMPRIAARSTKPATQSSPATCSASDTGWSTPLKSMCGTMPVMIAATTTYRMVQMISEPMMPIGRSRAGFLTSSAAEVTASKPMKAKNTSAAALITPVMPYGMYGCQFSGLTWPTPTAMNSSTTLILMITITLFRRADSRMPSDSRNVMAIMIRNAGRLNRVSTPGRAPGAAVSASGSTRPKPDSSDWK